MALNKKIILEKGIVANYFRIASIHQHYINQEPTLDIYIYGYTDETYRDKEKLEGMNMNSESVTSKFYQLPLDDTKGYTREDIYQRIKLEIPEFEGAKDI